MLLIVDGRAELEVPWDQAEVLGRALIAKAREAEEIAKADTIAFDHAILLRAGANLGLSNNPKIVEEAGKKAAWDSNLRRYMPGGVRSQENVGVPAVINKSPRRKP